ncbi:MAG: ATP-binding protein [Gemmatimonadota bacterium]|nr:ATP-binding protein [Gemmatimonadota bacterium]
MIRREHRQDYLRLLERYVDDAGEQHLLAAADLGRQFVLAGVPAEEIAELHEATLAKLARDRPIPELAKVVFASQPFMEVMMAYSLEFRLQVDSRLSAEGELREVNDELRRRVEELEIYKRVFQALPLGISVFALRDHSDAGSLEFVLGNPAAEATRAFLASRISDAERTFKDGEEVDDASLSDVCAEVVRRDRSEDCGVSVFEDGAGGEVCLHTRAFPLPGDHVALQVEDITARTKLEAQLRQAQKMEAVGRLAGGVAHDFNNVLTTILSFAEFAAERVGAEHPVYEDIQQVLRSAERAAALTRQLLSFSRNESQPRVLNPITHLRDVDHLIRRLLEEDVEIKTRLSDDLWNIRMDPGALEQVIINLAINARDALSGSGKITLESENLVVDEAGGSFAAALDPGEYVVLAVTDDGMGMSEEVRLRAFEPFYTTKDSSKGTGLGLSICSDLVEQAGGVIRIESRIGQGTTVRVIIPRVKEAAESLYEEKKLEDFSGSETILVAEDDEGVRRSSCRVLRESGYDVLPAANGAEAVEICESHRPQPHLLLTDVVMPELSGRELAALVGALAPDMRVLFMSGYTGEPSMECDDAEFGANLLQKPFSAETLVRRVREALDGDRDR